MTSFPTAKADLRDAAQEPNGRAHSRDREPSVSGPRSTAGARFTGADFTNLVRIVMLAVAGLAATIIVGKLSLTDAVKDIDAPLYDAAVTWLQGIPGVREFSVHVTRMGSLTYNRFAALAAGIIFGLWRRNPLLGITIAASMLGAQAFQEITKAVVDGTKPTHELLAGTPGPYFSGGVQRVIIMTGLILFPLRNASAAVRVAVSERAVWIVATFVGAVEALTRITTGAHWPIDLIVAFPIGLGLLWLIKQVMDMVDPPTNPGV